jgi:hypothetical protein
MTTTTTTKTSNRPSHELFFIEERRVDSQLAAALGRKVAENAVEPIWHKAGVAFTSTRGNINVYVGQRGEPGAKRYFISFSKQQEASENSRRPVADIFEPDADGNIDFRSDKVGVVFVNSDDSYTLLIGDRGDLEQLRYQLRATRPAPAARTKAAPEAKQQSELDEHILRMDTIRREEAAAAAEATKAPNTAQAPVTPTSRAVRRAPAAA